jgi:hypothetical protein
MSGLDWIPICTIEDSLKVALMISGAGVLSGTFSEQFLYINLEGGGLHRAVNQEALSHCIAQGGFNQHDM